MVDTKGYNRFGGSAPEGKELIAIFEDHGDSDARQEFEQLLHDTTESLFTAAYADAEKHGNVVKEGVPHVVIKAENVRRAAQVILPQTPSGEGADIAR